MNNIRGGPVASVPVALDGMGDVVELMSRLTPAGRFTSPDELIRLIVHPAAPESAHVAGVTIHIGGGCPVPDGRRAKCGQSGNWSARATAVMATFSR